MSIERAVVEYLEALTMVHEALEPRTYCEIGCWWGPSLSLSRSPTIAIDPKPKITFQILAPTRIFKMTSDEFFEDHDIVELFGEAVDFAFIDGMHQAEYALRDFVNLERNSHRAGVIAIDDILPADIAYTPRDQVPGPWCGDIYRVIRILREYRPDLRIDVYDVEMKGFCLVSNLDPSSTVLSDAMPEIEKRIENGDWLVDTTEDLWNVMQAQSSDMLAKHIEELQSMRQPVAA